MNTRNLKRINRIIWETLRCTGAVEEQLGQETYLLEVVNESGFATPQESPETTETRVAKLHAEMVLQLTNLGAFPQQHSSQTPTLTGAGRWRQTTSLSLKDLYRQCYTVLLTQSNSLSLITIDTRQDIHVLNHETASSSQVVEDAQERHHGATLVELPIIRQLDKRATPLDRSSILHLLSLTIC